MHPRAFGRMFPQCRRTRTELRVQGRGRKQPRKPLWGRLQWRQERGPRRSPTRPMNGPVPGLVCLRTVTSKPHRQGADTSASLPEVKTACLRVFHPKNCILDAGDEVTDARTEKPFQPEGAEGLLPVQMLTHTKWAQCNRKGTLGGKSGRCPEFGTL